MRQSHEAIHRRISGINRFAKLSDSQNWKSKYNLRLEEKMEYKRYNFNTWLMVSKFKDQNFPNKYSLEKIQDNYNPSFELPRVS